MKIDVRNQFTYKEIFYGWLELIRPPNLFTIPGDILAGASLALIGKNEIHLIIPAVVISLFLYASGLILNDYFDTKTDRIERPSRPVPSGKIPSKEALAASVILIAAAIFLSLSMSGIKFLPVDMSLHSIRKTQVMEIVSILVVLIVLYNGLARKIPWTGFAVMGLCRGCNVLLGAAVTTECFSNKVFYGAGIETFYIASVSSIAYTEAKSTPGNIRCWLPYISLLALVVMVLEKISLTGICALFVALGYILFILRKIRYENKHIPERVGDLISSLILIQCTFIAVFMNHNGQFRYYGFSAIILLYLLFFASHLTAKKFYRS